MNRCGAEEYSRSTVCVPSNSRDLACSTGYINNETRSTNLTYVPVYQLRNTEYFGGESMATK